MKKLLPFLLLLFALPAAAQDQHDLGSLIIDDVRSLSTTVLLAEPPTGPVVAITVGHGLQLTSGVLSALGSGSGNVVGPLSDSDSDIVLFDGTDGTLIKDAGISLASLVRTSATVNGHALSSNVTVTKADVGLGSAENTADAAKAVLSSTKLVPGRTINGVLFDGTQDITVSSPNQALTIGTHLTGGSYDGTAPITIATDAVSTNTASKLVVRDGNGDFSARNITAALIGNSSTATKLAATSNINGVAFDGSGNITVAAAAGTLTGTTLASNVLASSLTSVGTLTAGATGAGFTIALSDSTVTGTLSAARLPATANFDSLCLDVANHDGCLARRGPGIIKLANGSTAQRYEVYGNDTGTLATSYDCYIVPPANNASRADFGCGDAADATAFSNSLRFITGTAGFVFFNGATRVAIATQANAAINIRSDLQYGFSQTASGPEIDTITAGLQWDASGSVKVTNGSSGIGSIRTGMFSSTASEVIASASIIAPTHSVFHVSGTSEIDTITQPAQCTATCVIDIIPDAVFTTGTSGNIFIASTAVIGKVLQMVWDGIKWNPSY